MFFHCQPLPRAAKHGPLMWLGVHKSMSGLNDCLKAFGYKPPHDENCWLILHCLSGNVRKCRMKYRSGLQECLLKAVHLRPLRFHQIKTCPALLTKYVFPLLSAFTVSHKK